MKRTAQYAALVGYLVFLGFPLVWLVSTAFKGPRELASIDPTWIPREATTANFTSAFSEQPLVEAGMNSLTIAVSSSLITMVLAVPAAYVLARYRSTLTRLTTGWILVSQMFPFVLVIIPLFLLLKSFYLVDSQAGLVLVYVVWNLPFTLWMLQGYVRAIPPELEEAASVDGASRGKTLRHIVFPLLTPGLVATVMFSFISSWNEFFFALVLLKTPEKQTLPVLLTRFLGAEGVADLGPLAAAALLTTIPSLLFFMFIQRRLTAGMLTGAVKG
ncbi:carbohydrate ABC transporter permease [Allokutzneria oryzae]|uniref:Carbohydrate ABC transporter permease n=1 Tax=Allokutzneria oryzae TaxID=1378989 RepID=A0ABV5ZSY6_9PSEU